MNEWLKKVFGKIKEMWSKWKPIQKVIIIGIIVVIIVAIVFTARLSSKPSEVKLFNAQITDTNNLTSILDRLDEAHVDATERDGYIYVKDTATKRRMTAILNDEGLIPSNVDIWADYFDRSWSTTDADQNVKLQNKKQQELKNFIESYADVQWANVAIVLPPSKIFSEQQNPVTCAVSISQKGNSNLLTDRKRILGIHRAILSAVEGLLPENLTITDAASGIVVNDFAAMADSDAVDVAAKQKRLVMNEEARYRAKILEALQKYIKPDRVRDVIVTVEMDFSQEKSEATVHSMIEKIKDNPDTPYDESEVIESIPISSQTVTRQYTQKGLTPEGPPGVEGQTPPSYVDLSNVEGQSVETGVTVNNAINTKQVSRVEDAKIKRITASVDIDGKWTGPLPDPENPKKFLIDEVTGLRKRNYTALTQRDIDDYTNVVKGGIAYNRDRGDQVWVISAAYDRDEEFRLEDEEWKKREQRATTIALVLAGIVVVLIGFIVFRIVSKEIERRRREREARLLAEQQAERERKLWEAKEDGMDVTMSVEETRRMELQENAITMAKEHPEDVAMLIRTWLMEE